MKKTLILAAILGLGFATLSYADMTPTAAAMSTPVAKKAHKTHKHHKKHAKKATPAMAPTAAPTAAAAK